MVKCRNCGEELSSTAVFCKKCGAAIVKDVNIEENVNQEATFQELSLEMRNISDQMIAFFVSSMKQMEVEKKMLSDNSQKEIAKLKEQLNSSKVELDNFKETLQEKENLLIKANEKIKDLECVLLNISSGNLESEEILKGVQNNGEEKDKICRGCGEIITEDMIFCASCGMKLK